MAYRFLLIAVCLTSLAGAAWFGTRAGDESWREIAPGLYVAPGPVAGYAIVGDGKALLIDAPLSRGDVVLPNNPTIEAVVLTHPHRPVLAGVPSFLQAKIPVKAPKAAAEWLTPDGVKKYWAESLPLRSSRTAYLVPPVGFAGIECSLEPGQKLDWGPWSLEWLDVPGHARSQLALIAKRNNGKAIAFVGGAMASPGKIFAPYTTDWDHWTDAGLAPAAKSLDALAAVKVDIVCPAYGPPIVTDVSASLRRTADALREAGFLKSFERYTKTRLGNAPQYAFLAKEQAESNGSKPWTRVSEHLYLTGNTYVLVSKDGPCLMVDPWAPRSSGQWQTLQREKNIGPLEVVWFSHAHYDHYDGVYDLPNPEKFEAWTLDLVAPPLEEPFRWRAPFLDPRPVKIHRKPKPGDTLTWREYRFKFHHLPGQSLYTMGVETVIDGKKCFFTGDNYYHQDMFAGTGGWMGLNRAFPPYYAASAKTVLDAAPDWVLAEHGGPFAFHAEDWRRRIAWAEAAGRALDDLSQSGKHLWDYNPHMIHVEPVVSKAKAGEPLTVDVVFENALDRAATAKVRLEGREVLATEEVTLTAAAGKSAKQKVAFSVPADLAAGRHVFAVSATEGGRLCPADSFFVVDIVK
jgi:glyoxylase-like metal-dependent hydrolase (beta-lactamase superfamily II)